MALNQYLLINTLEDAGFSPDLIAGGKELCFSCPLCFHEKKKLYVSTETGLWMCHRCGESGHLLSLLIRVVELTFATAYPLAESISAKPVDAPVVLEAHRPPRPSFVNLPPGFMGDDGSRYAGDYFAQRGLRRHWVREIGAGYCLVGPYAHRVILPVVTQGGLRTYVARTWKRYEKKKVLMPLNSQAARALFGYDLLEQERRHWNELIIVEGVFDALRLWDLGYRETVATLGAHITDLQMALVKRLAPKRVVLMRDADAAGEEAYIKEGRMLFSNMFNVSVAHLPSGLDPGVVTAQDIQTALHGAVPVELDYGSESLREGQAHGKSST